MLLAGRGMGKRKVTTAQERKHVQIKVIFKKNQKERKLEGLQKPMQVNITSLKTA